MEREECRGEEAPKLNNDNQAKMIKKRGEEPMRQALYRMSGVDLTGIDAIGVGAVQAVLTEYGPDLSSGPAICLRSRSSILTLWSGFMPSIQDSSRVRYVAPRIMWRPAVKSFGLSITHSANAP